MDNTRLKFDKSMATDEGAGLTDHLNFSASVEIVGMIRKGFFLCM